MQQHPSPQREVTSDLPFQAPVMTILMLPQQPQLVVPLVAVGNEWFALPDLTTFGTTQGATALGGDDGVVTPSLSIPFTHTSAAMVNSTVPAPPPPKASKPMEQQQRRVLASVKKTDDRAMQPSVPATADTTSTGGSSINLSRVITNESVIPDAPHYRLQLNAMRIGTDTLGSYLKTAKKLLVETWYNHMSRDPRSVGLAEVLSSQPLGLPTRDDNTENGEMIKSANEGEFYADETLFPKVPLVEIAFNHNILTDEAMPMIHEFVASNHHIRSLEILGNRFTDQCAASIRDLIIHCPHLQRIKLADNLFTEECARVIGETLLELNRDVHPTQMPSTATHLTESGDGHRNDAYSVLRKRLFLQLNIGGNSIGDRGVSVICDAAYRSGVEILGLRDVKIGPLGWAAVGALCAAGRRRHLGHHRFEVTTSDETESGESDDESTEPQEEGDDPSPPPPTLAPPCDSPALYFPPPAIQELQLKRNAMDYSCMESFVLSALGTLVLSTTAVIPPYDHNISLSSITLSGCQMDAVMCTRLVALLQQCSCLEHLDLGHNNIGDEGVTAIAHWFANEAIYPRRLSSICLECNHITVIGLQALATAVHGPETRNAVAAMVMRASSVDDSAALDPQEIRDRVKESPVRIPLTLVDLSANDLDAVSTLYLALFFAATPLVEKIFLRGCRLGGGQLLGLVTMLCGLKHLTDLDFSSNMSGSDGEHWQLLIQTSPILRRLLLTDNSMPGIATQSIAQAVCLAVEAGHPIGVVQIGGKSKVEPLGNVVSPTSHALILKALQRGGGGGVQDREK